MRKEAEEDKLLDIQHLAVFAAAMTWPKASSFANTKVSAKSVCRHLDDNSVVTSGVVLTLNGKAYLLPMHFLQQLNFYPCQKGDVLAPFQLVKTAAQIVTEEEGAYGDDCEFEEDEVTKVKDMFLNFTANNKHLCPGEKNMCL